jgi:hypothetical protein
MALEALLAKLKAGAADGTPGTPGNGPGVPQSQEVKSLILADKSPLRTPGTPRTPKNNSTGRASETQPVAVPPSAPASMVAERGGFSDLVAVEPVQPESPMPVTEPERETAVGLKGLQVNEDLEASPPCEPEPPSSSGPDLSDVYGRAKQARYIFELEAIWCEIDQRKAAWQAHNHGA